MAPGTYQERASAPAGAGEGKIEVNALSALSFVPGKTHFLPAYLSLPNPSAGFCSIFLADALLEGNHGSKSNGRCSNSVTLEKLLLPARWGEKGAAVHDGKAVLFIPLAKH